MTKKGYIYCSLPKCEIEVYCIDICYDYNILKRNNYIIITKKVYNPKKIKKKFYKKFKKSLLISNIFSNIKLENIENFFNKIKSI